MVKFRETKNRLNSLKIDEIEKYVGLKFPHEYRLHLLNHNGGECEPNVFQFIENGELTESYIDTFLAIYAGSNDNLKQDIDTYKIDEKRLPHRMLPIANDPGGNLICISCEGNDNGRIYFWDHENEVDYSVSPDNDYSNLYIIANTFDEFINGLQKDLSL